MKGRRLFSALGLGLGLALALLWLLSGPGARLPVVRAASHTVCPAGPPTCDYSTIQAAVDAAADGDTIKVAAGTYTDVQERPVPAGYPSPPASGTITQVVYISKSVTIRGGYTTTNGFADPPNPEANPTTLDALGQGRVLVIAGEISPTIEGLRITGGDASGLGGSVRGWDAGGGVYVASATAAIRNNLVFSNVAMTGGGALFDDSPGTVLSNNVISGNSARSGGGLKFGNSPTATLIANTICGNMAHSAGAGMKNHAGVLFEYSDNATLISNTISGNWAANDCGGVCFEISHNAVLSHNVIISNTRGRGWDGRGVGVYLKDSENADLVGNTISSNTAYAPDAPGTIWGGGLCIDHSTATLISNTVRANGATRGGGLYVASNSIVTLTSNTIAGNVVYDACGTWCESPKGTGGGLHLSDSTATLANNVIADNRVEVAGGGLYVERSAIRLLHSTIARNGGGDGSGVYITGTSDLSSSVVMTNTILVSHTVGITVAAGNTATLTATLWGTGTWVNQADWGGEGAIFTGTINLWGDPDFVDPDMGDYHIGPDSAARDAGVAAGVTSDMDGDPRPIGTRYDIGADEFRWRIYLPVTVKNHP